MNTSAWFGLAGVCLGAVITGGFSYLTTRRKERADAAAERRREGVAVQRAARLIDADLRFAEAAARICIERKKWWWRDRPLTSEGWQQYRDVIASKLPWSDWAAVMTAVEAVNHLQSSRDGALKLQRAKLAIDPETRDVLAAADRLDIDITDPGPAIPEATVTQIEPILADLKAGRAALAPLTQREPSL
jgi:hypothetical protein